MENLNYSTAIQVEQTAEEVFNLICNVPEWWSKDFSGKSSNLHDEFVIDHPNQHYSRQRVIEFVPYQSMVWLVTESRLNWLKNNDQEWTNTEMEFQISSAENKVRIQFTHKGLSPEKECYSMCEQGWNMVIREWLYHYLTTGKPSEEMKKAAEIRNRHLKNMGKE